MDFLLAISRGIDRTTALIGRLVAWLILLSVLVSAGNATTRKLWSLSSNAWLELQWYLFGAAFLLAAAYTLQRNEHIRIDIISNLLPKAVRNWLDVFCHVTMLLPFTILIMKEAIPWTLNSYRIGETSNNFGGLIQWPGKFLIVAGFFLLAVQALSEIIKRTAVMLDLIPDPYDAVDTTGPIE